MTVKVWGAGLGAVMAMAARSAHALELPKDSLHVVLQVTGDQTRCRLSFTVFNRHDEVLNELKLAMSVHSQGGSTLHVVEGTAAFIDPDSAGVFGATVPMDCQDIYVVKLRAVRACTFAKFLWSNCLGAISTEYQMGTTSMKFVK